MPDPQEIIQQEPYVPAPGAPVLSGSIDDYPGGIVIPVDKPYRWTSADVIRKLKYAAIRHFGKKNLKVGHAGTLDPLATGVLLVCVGNATKLAEQMQKHDKEYLAGLTIGATTPSFDLEKDIDLRCPYSHVTEELLREAAGEFVGEQDQVAPLFSAKSVDGVRAYEIARKAFKAGEPIPDDVIRASRIRIDECELVWFGQQTPVQDDAASPETCTVVSPEASSAASGRINVAQDDPLLPHALIRVACTKGTYIRALARDMGEAVGSGAFLNSLRRTRSGIFTVDKALTMEEANALFRRV